MTCDEHEALRKEAGHMRRFLQRLNAPDRLFPRLLETFLRVRARDEPAFARQLLRSGGAKEVAEAACASDKLSPADQELLADYVSESGIGSAAGDDEPQP